MDINQRRKKLNIVVLSFGMEKVFFEKVESIGKTKVNFQYGKNNINR